MRLLSIGGSDPSSGAGIQADIKTFEAHGAYALTVTTALTAQNTVCFAGAEPVSSRMLKSQLDVLLSDFEISGIKIGMVYTSEAAKIISKCISGVAGRIPVVVDPVIYSTTGGSLLRESALGPYMKYVMPLATVITPNLQEACMLLNIANQKNDYNDYFKMASDMLHAASIKSAVIITGVTLAANCNSVTDVVAERGKTGGITTYCLTDYPAVTNGETHGGGCAYSAALLCELASGKTVHESAKAAQEFVARLMQHPTKAGIGIPILSAGIKRKDADDLKLNLARAAGMFCLLKEACRCIPECQTNFVYAGADPRTTKDVLGIQGRIIRIGDTVAMAGDVTYGGSKHVASALIAMCKKFPQIRSAINIRHAQDTIDAIDDLNMHAAYYDRRCEPEESKLQEGSTIQWGVAHAIKNIETAPDAVCHDGDYGKEPMIIIFGATPDEVVGKIKKILSHTNSCSPN